MGFSLIENFDRPWLAKDIQDFWNRWNISLSRFFKDYFFSPLSHAVFYHITPRLQFVFIAFIYILTMVIIALWHGLTVGFLVFGVLQGLALVIAQVMRKLGSIYNRG